MRSYEMLFVLCAQFQATIKEIDKNDKIEKTQWITEEKKIAHTTYNLYYFII